MSIFSPEVALLIIDMANDSVSRDGSMYVPGAEDIVPAIKQLSDEARIAGSPVIYICDMQGTSEAEVVSPLKPEAHDFVVRRHQYSSFFGTELDTLLNELGVTKLVLTGTAVEICVYFTAADAYMRGYKIIVPERCVVALSEGDAESALDQMQRLFDAEIV